MGEEAIKLVAQQALSAISVEGKTEIVEVSYDENKFHALMRIGNGSADKNDQAIERWWKEVITTVLYNSAGEPWELHICTEYRIGQTGELGYIWNFIFSSPDLISTLPVVSELIAGVSATASLQRVRLDSIRVGPADRNKVSGETRYGKPSKKGAVVTQGRNV